MIKKLIIGILIFAFPYVAFADSYILYYGNGCSHCAKVEKYMKDNSILNVEKKEIYFDSNNRNDFLKATKELGIKTEKAGVPFLYITKDDNTKEYLFGDTPIIDFLGNIKSNDIQNLSIGESKDEIITKDFAPWKFFLILLPAAISDSINPCAFAVILILLGAVLTRFKSRKKVVLTGLMFSLAIFLSYFLMGLGLYNFLGNLETTFYFKVSVGVLGIIIGLANLKDFFWYGKGFIMEVPHAWRPKMKSLLKKVTSPLGGFVIGLIVSLFLLPCTSGPYLTVLGYLSTESSVLQHWGYIYLIIYNIIFILPMVVITLIVAYGYISIGSIMEFKEDKKELIHLIVGILMLLLGIYVIGDSIY